ncbi:MAG: AAA family ATPase [Solirubrobacteraceae bacterium]
MTPAAALLGRESEIKILDEVIDDVQEHGAALVLRGDPGIGKSALLVAAAERATAHGLRVLTTSSIHSEAELAFAGLHQLLQSVLGQMERLAPAQREAMLAAFGMIDKPAASLFLTALATLELLADVASREPVLVIADDAHWMDRATADVLTFVARRIESEPIVLIAAIREGTESPLADAGLPALHLEALDESAAATVLKMRAPGLAQAARRRVLDEAAGNPLALVELPKGLQDGAPLPAWLPLTTRLEQAFAGRVHALPAATRTALLLAAISDSSRVTEVLDASGLVLTADLTMGVLTPAVTAGLIEIDDSELRFSHPLVRSAIHQASSQGQRRAAHAALAAVLVDQPERRVWHRAASVLGTDEAVADELEVAAINAQRRGATVIAVRAFERASKLSEDPTQGVTRIFRAAELAFEIGEHEVALAMLREAERFDLGPREQTRLAWIRASFGDGLAAEAPRARSLAGLAVRTADDGDAELALRLLYTAALQCWWADPGPTAGALVVAAAERIDVHEDDGRLLQILACASPIERGATVYSRLSRLRQDPGRDAAAARLVGNAATAIGAFEIAAEFLAIAVVGLRAQGRLGLLARALAVQSSAAAHLGNLALAIPAAEESVRLARETMQPQIAAMGRVTQVMVAALRGEQATVDTISVEIEEVCVPIRASGVLAELQLARGVAALGGGRPAEAYEHLRRIYDSQDPAYHVSVRCFAVADLAEAGVRSGHRQAVQQTVTGLETLAVKTPSPLLHIGLAHARALIAEDTVAEQTFQTAMKRDLSHWPLCRARLQLAYGEWLRHCKRSTESRAPLRYAREIFDALGAVPWGEHARQQLRASGETSRRRIPEARDQLTPQELQIAQLAADGLTNREIGQMLYLSHRTISSHLYRTFPKLGVTSRGELRAALEPRTPEPA